MKLDRSIAKLKKGEPLKLVALGDSLTSGWMARKGYLDFLGEMIKEKFPAANIDFINSGMPGDSAMSGLYRLRMDVLDLNPHLVFVQFALNDAFSGYGKQSFRDTILEIVETIRNDSDAEIAVITSVYINDRSLYRIGLEFYRILEDIAALKNLPIALVHEYWEKSVLAGADFSKLVQRDGVHPTVEGYRLMAEAIMQLF